MTATTAKTRTITLTDRPPIKIIEDDWPVIATASHHESDNYPNPPIRETKASIRVRQHEDGRAVIYAAYGYSSAWQGERDDNFRAGLLLEAGGGLVEGIKDVAATMADETGDGAPWSRLAAECIADLPAETI